MDGNPGSVLRGNQQAENAKLKRMYAELALDNAAMKDLIAKKL